MGVFTAKRVEDGVLLLQQTEMKWDKPASRSRPGSASATASFTGIDVQSGEKIYGGGPIGDVKGVALPIPWDLTIEDTEWYPEHQGKDSLVPLFYSTKGWGLLWNLPSYGTIHIDASGMHFSSAATLVVDFWVETCPVGGCKMTTAPHPFISLLSQATDVIGHAPPLPSFATGFIQCKDRQGARWCSY